jgi:soluble lytic murein transglycosylase-like protein
MEASIKRRWTVVGRVGLFAVLMTLVVAPAEAHKPVARSKNFAAMYIEGSMKPASSRSSRSRSIAGGDRAVRRYCGAAKAGDRNAQFNLGYIYALGRGVRRNAALAAAWFRKAAAQGHPQARNWSKLLRGKAKQAECILSDGLPIGAARKFATHPAKGPIVDMVRNLAPEYKLDPNLVLAVIEAESNFNPTARSYKNAQGLMQLIPETAQRFGVEDVWDPEQNLRGGMAYLRWLLDYFNGDVSLALAGYNAGEKAVDRYKGIPPYVETRDYVSRIAGRLAR